MDEWSEEIDEELSECSECGCEEGHTIQIINSGEDYLCTVSCGNESVDFMCEHAIDGEWCPEPASARESAIEEWNLDF